MAKPQKSTAQSEVPGLVKKGPLYYLKRDWQLYALMLLPMVFIIVFKYFAYTGLSVAFLDYKIGKGYAGSKFVGLKIFEKVFKHRDFTKAVVNTLLLNVLDLIFSFPMPIILALLLNEIRVKWFKRTTQTLLYLPHFLSWVVIGAVAYQMFATQSGVVNALIANAGKSPIPFLQEDGWWLFSYVLIGVWQTMGWGTIIYLAAITNVNSELYEAAKVDGANRWQQCLHVTLPCIRSTIVVMLIMQLGKLMGGSFERIVAFADYDATRPNDTLTRAEALELAIKALKLFPINVYNDLYSDIVGHETYAGTIQCAAQNDLIPPEWVADGSLYPNQTVTAADFLAVLIPGAAGRRPLADAVPVPDSVPVYARRAVGQAVAEGLIAPEALTKPLNRSNAAEICRRLHI